MPDFSVLSKPAGEAKRPPLYPMGDYPGIIAGAPQQLTSAIKKTEYLRFPIKLTEWPSDAPESWTQIDDQGVATDYSRREIDLAAKTWDGDFYLSENALFMFDEFIKSCGLAVGRPYAEIIPELIGQRVLVGITQEMSERNSRLFNRVGRISGLQD